MLNQNGVKADFYHAGLESAQRSARQDNWIHNRTRVIVATNAFGMGIDKPDVRVVVHMDLPDTLEAYYQKLAVGAATRRKPTPQPSTTPPTLKTCASGSY